jgi:hypothetical protein
VSSPPSARGLRRGGPAAAHRPTVAALGSSPAAAARSSSLEQDDRAPRCERLATPSPNPDAAGDQCLPPPPRSPFGDATVSETNPGRLRDDRRVDAFRSAIRSHTTACGTATSLSRVETDDGIVGWGECISQWPGRRSHRDRIERGLAPLLQGPRDKRPRVGADARAVGTGTAASSRSRSRPSTAPGTSPARPPASPARAPGKPMTASARAPP